MNNKQPKTKTTLTLCIVLLFVLSVFVPLLSLPTTEAATFYNYTMSPSGSNYVIKNSGGAVIYTSSSSSNVFNTMIIACYSGYHVYVESGAYNVDAKWLIYTSNIIITFQHQGETTPNVMGNICGSGTTTTSNGAILTAAVGLNDVILWDFGNYNVIEGVTINGNAPYQTDDGIFRYPGRMGLNVDGSNCVIKSSTVHNTIGGGIHCAGSYSGATNCKVYDIGINGLQTWNGVGIYFVNCEVSTVADVGVDAYAHNGIFTGNYIHDMGWYINGNHGTGHGACWAIGLEGNGIAEPSTTGTGDSWSNMFVIANNRIERCNTGIQIGTTPDAANYVLISGNTLTDCTLNDSWGYGAINIYHGSNCIISHNTLTNGNIGIGIGFPYHFDSNNNYVYNNVINGFSTTIENFGYNTMYTQPPKVAVTVTSSPTGVALVSADGSYGYAGTYSSSPYTIYRSVGTTIALYAVTTNSGYNFNSWSNGGGQTQSINAPTTYTVYTATYGGGPLPTTNPTPNPSTAPNTATFGTTTIGASSTTLFSGIPRANQYTPTSSGIVTDIMLYLSGNGHVQTAIYADSANSPGALLAQSTSDLVTTIGWHDFTGFNLNITAGTSYWLAAQADSSNIVWYYNSGGANYCQGNGTYGTFPNPYSVAYTGNYDASIYARYTTSTTTTSTMNYTNGQNFIVTSLNGASNLTFTVTSGSLNGTSNTNSTNTGGVFQIWPDTTGTFVITTSGVPTSVFINGAYANNVPFSFFPGDPIVVTWTYGQNIYVNSNGIQYYFKDETYTTLGVLGNGLDRDYGNTYATINQSYTGTDSVTYSFEVSLFSSATHLTELTSGPSATIVVSGNYTGTLTGTVVIPETDVILGYQALYITILRNFGTALPTVVTQFVSPVLITSKIETSSWEFVLDIDQIQTGGLTNSSIRFGNTDYQSGINNILFENPHSSEVQAWRLAELDLVGFVLASYLVPLGTAFYALLLVLFGGVLYFRYGHFGIVTFFFVLFGGTGGLVWILFPPWIAAVAAALIILGTTTIVWRIIR